MASDADLQAMPSPSARVSRMSAATKTNRRQPARLVTVAGTLWQPLFLGHWPANTRTGTHKNTGLHALGGRGFAAGRVRLNSR
jgi:hypothetical protein